MAELERAIRKLGPEQRRDGLYQPPEAAPIPDSAGRAPNGVAKGAAGGDLIEPSFTARTYHPPQTIRSTDGLLMWEYRPVRDVVMQDAKGEAVTLTFAEPRV